MGLEENAEVERECAGSVSRRRSCEKRGYDQEQSVRNGQEDEVDRKREAKMSNGRDQR